MCERERDSVRVWFFILSSEQSLRVTRATMKPSQRGGGSWRVVFVFLSQILLCFFFTCLQLFHRKKKEGVNGVEEGGFFSLSFLSCRVNEQGGDDAKERGARRTSGERARLYSLGEVGASQRSASSPHIHVAGGKKESLLTQKYLCQSRGTLPSVSLMSNRCVQQRHKKSRGVGTEVYYARANTRAPAARPRR